MYRRLFAVPPALVAAVASTVVAFSAVVPEAEASFARKLSGKLSRNPSTATQQLTADPPQTLDGTVSVYYDPSLFTLYFPPQPASADSALFVDSPGFMSEPLIGVIDEPGSEPRFIPRGQFADTGDPRVEAGEIRVSFTRFDVSSPIVLPPEPGYGEYVTEPGFEQGDDLFAVIFYERASYAVLSDRFDPVISDVIPGAPPVIAPFSLTVTPGQTMRIIEDGSTEPTILLPTDVTPGVIAFPEPGALGVLALAGVGLCARRRKRST